VLYTVQVQWTLYKIEARAVSSQHAQDSSSRLHPAGMDNNALIERGLKRSGHEINIIFEVCTCSCKTAIFQMFPLY
jgi:hypothetical protein